MTNIRRFCRASLRKYSIPASRLLEIMDTRDLAYFLRVVKA